jgi:hypothetical protein
MKNSGIYQIECMITEKIYVDCSLDMAKALKIQKRLLETRHHENYALQNDYIKYGLHSFTFGPLLYCDPTSFKFYKEYFVKYFSDLYLCYNLA